MADSKKNNKIRIILLILMGGLTLYTLVIWFFNYRTLQQTVTTIETTAQEQSVNFRYYVQEYRSAKTALDTANQKVAELTAELAAANAELASTRTELSSLQGMNDDLKGTILSLEHYKVKAHAKGEALESMINAFRKKNKQLDADLQVVRRELAVFQPDISDVTEGKSKILLFRNHIRLVKKNMHVLKEQALSMKIAAQQQHDRLEMLYGNNGYMVKDGQDQSIKRQGAKVDIKVEFK